MVPLMGLLQGLLNPVIAGFDILYLGKSGFTTLARAKIVKVRSKGSKGPWQELRFNKRHTTKLKKENALFRLLKKLSFIRDIEAEKKKQAKATKKKKKKAPIKRKKTKAEKEAPPPEPEPKKLVSKKPEKPKKAEAPSISVKFKKPKVTYKAITTRDGKQIFIKKYEFGVDRDVNFVEGEKFDKITAREYIAAVKQEFQKLYKEHGRTGYLVRLHHEYKNFVNYYDAYPKERPEPKAGEKVKDKGFGGYSLNRQDFMNQAQIDDQFDNILNMKYFASFSRYLDFANPSTEFNFSGFMVEVTTGRVKHKNN